MITFRKLVQIAALVVLSALTVTGFVSASGPISTDFEPFAVGTAAEDLGIPGADFASPFNPMSWTVQTNTEYMTLHNNILTHKNNDCNAALVIRLEVAHNVVGFQYAISRESLVLKVDGWLGAPGSGQLQFSQNYNGAFMGSPTGAREGVAHSSGVAFDHLVIYAPGGCAAIDNLRITGGARGRPVLTLPNPPFDLEVRGG